MSQSDILFAVISTFVIICSIFAANSEMPVKTADAAHLSSAPPLDKASTAYHRLRSCHRVLREESGEFFSPDFLCAPVPLWCNWTVVAPAGRRIRLQLKDFTAGAACGLKRDQVHLDEPGGHRTLERCWGSAVYTSASETLSVGLLVDPGIEPVFRGFHARYHTFALPAAAAAPPLATPAPPPPPAPPLTAANEANWSGKVKEEPFLGREEGEKPAVELAQMDAGPVLGGTTVRSPSLKDGGEWAGSDSPPARTGEPETQASEAEKWGVVTKEEGPPQPKRDSGEPLRTAKNPSDDRGASNRPAKSDRTNEVLADTDGEEGGRSRDPVRKRPSPPTAAPSPIADTPPETPSPAPSAEFREPDPDKADASEPGSRSTRRPREGWDDDEEDDALDVLGGDEDDGDGPPAVSMEREGVGVIGGRGLAKPPEASPVLEHSPRERPDVVRLLRNSTTLASLPGENLFEVSVEVRLAPGVNENWDILVRSVMSSVQTMIQDQLITRLRTKSISSIRIKRLSSGVLFIFWLHFGEGRDGVQVHKILQKALSPLQERKLSSRGRKEQPTIASVSSEDVNECGTQLVLCDTNAECINRFGSYACRCHPGFQDRSRLGSGGTICVAPPGTGPVQAQPPPPSPSRALVNFLYGLCFLLAVLVVVLLCVSGALYRRHHRGAFVVPCYRRGQNGGTPGADSASSQLPPPPPPVRRPKDGWGSAQDRCPSTDLPLLKFAPLPPPDTPQYGQQDEADQL